MVIKMYFSFHNIKVKYKSIERYENTGFAMRAIMLITVFILAFNSLPVQTYAQEGDLEDLINEANERKNNPIESDEIEGWPKGPRIGAEAAVLMDADSGQIIYAKNIDAKLFPASTTKIMTCVVAMENAKLTDEITINQSAIDANDADGSNMGLYANEILTLDELIHGILISSANEACNAVAQHIAGDMDSYVELMNKKAAELGCTNTHFVSTNGLANPEHYTTARDLATIGRVFFSYDFLCKTASTGMYEIPETDKHRAHSLYSKNKLYKGREFAYEYLVGSKTGFTSEARQTLVSCAEKDGVRLIAVILKEESPYQFQDTAALFEYGFNNFFKVNVAANETKYTLSHNDFFDSDGLMFGRNAPIISLDKDSYLLLPSGIEFANLTSKVTYSDTMDKYFGTVDYYYNDVYMGCAGIAFEDANAGISYVTDAPGEDVIVADGNKAINKSQNPKTKEKEIIVDIKKVMIYIISIIAIIVVGIYICMIAKKILKSDKNLQNRKRRKEMSSRRRRQILNNLRKHKRNVKKRYGMGDKPVQYNSLKEMKVNRDYIEDRTYSIKPEKKSRTNNNRLNKKSTGKNKGNEKVVNNIITKRNDINFDDFNL